MLLFLISPASFLELPASASSVLTEKSSFLPSMISLSSVGVLLGVEVLAADREEHYLHDVCVEPERGAVSVL
jgi:hypothetical protein